MHGVVKINQAGDYAHLSSPAGDPLGHCVRRPDGKWFGLAVHDPTYPFNGSSPESVMNKITQSLQLCAGWSASSGG